MRNLGYRLKSLARDWLQSWRAMPTIVEEDALRLMQEFGDNAYRVARERALAERRGAVIDADRQAGHWDKVRAEIGRRTLRQATDTATRYGEE